MLLGGTGSPLLDFAGFLGGIADDPDPEESSGSSSSLLCFGLSLNPKPPMILVV
jgi:hypothetical protein